MTKRSLIALLSAVILAVLVIATVFLYYFNTENKTEDTRSVISMVTIVFIALLSILIVYLSKIKKKQYVRNLNKEYFAEYEIIKDSVMNAQLSVKIKKEIIADILDMFISAQNDKRSVKDVIKNTEVFVKEIIETYTKTSIRIIFNILDGFVYFILFVIGTYIYLWFNNTHVNFFDNRIDFLSVLLFVLISFALIPFIKKVTSKGNPWMFILPLIFGITFVLIAEMLRKFFYEAEIVRYILDEEIAIISNIVILAVFVAAVPGIYLLKGYVRQKFLRR